MNKMPPASKAVIARLRRQIGALEGAGHGNGAVAFGVPALDDALPWGGLCRGALHEVAGTPGDGAVLGFAALVLARTGMVRPVLWCRTRQAVADHGALYGPGLAAVGVDPRRVIFVTVATTAEALWVLEEGLRCDALSAVVGEGAAPDFTASRRLQLAARQGQAMGLLLLPAGADARASAALTRWRVTSLASQGSVSWRVALEQCRGGRPHTWKMEARDAALRGAVALPLADGPLEEAASLTTVP